MRFFQELLVISREERLHLIHSGNEFTKMVKIWIIFEMNT
jgi:hypothetical protein